MLGFSGPRWYRHVARKGQRPGREGVEVPSQGLNSGRAAFPGLGGAGTARDTPAGAGALRPREPEPRNAGSCVPGPPSARVGSTRGYRRPRRAPERPRHRGKGSQLHGWGTAIYRWASPSFRGAGAPGRGGGRRARTRPSGSLLRAGPAEDAPGRGKESRRDLRGPCRGRRARAPRPGSLTCRPLGREGADTRPRLTSISSMRSIMASRHALSLPPAAGAAASDSAASDSAAPSYEARGARAR